MSLSKKISDLPDNKIPRLLVKCLDEWGITSLTDIQEKAIQHDVHNGVSAIVSAPTSSGKTLVGEMALVVGLNKGFNALYLVSHKALAEQKFSDFLGRFSGPNWSPPISIGISTGDHDEGDVNCQLLISTYEKALGLLLADRINVPNTIVIADELQILGEENRGPSIETLCALLRQQRPHQFLGLTATAENPDDLGRV